MTLVVIGPEPQNVLDRTEDYAKFKELSPEDRVRAVLAATDAPLSRDLVLQAADLPEKEVGPDVEQLLSANSVSDDAGTFYQITDPSVVSDEYWKELGVSRDVVVSNIGEALLFDTGTTVGILNPPIFREEGELLFFNELEPEQRIEATLACVDRPLSEKEVFSIALVLWSDNDPEIQKLRAKLSEYLLENTDPPLYQMQRDPQVRRRVLETIGVDPDDVRFEVEDSMAMMD